VAYFKISQHCLYMAYLPLVPGFLMTIRSDGLACDNCG
jgi:hypothetical protein